MNYNNMTSQELKKSFFEYFQSQNHALISSASLIPENDPTVLFTTAGMHPLVPYLVGEKHPEGNRLVNVQKCVRTGDIDEVGDATHHTFFEMLGNWSLGDYFKEETIKFSWEFLTGTLKLDKKNLAVSIFGGNEDVPNYDSQSEKVWLDLGVAQDRIEKIKENWWGPAGQTGPCGPDTEIFYWTGQGDAPEVFHEDDNGWVEIWNNVIMQYNKTADGKYEALKQKNIDTGMGFERTLAVLNGFDDNYLTELWQPIIKQLEKLSGKKYEDDKKSFRIIADHIRSAVFMMGDPRGIAPSNKDQGYVLRRLIRRAIRFGKSINIENNFCVELAEIIINLYKSGYSELVDNKKFIISELTKEEEKFTKTLAKGLKEFTKLKTVDGKAAFVLFSTYGFPLEMTEELAQESNIKINKQEFEAEFKKHQELSRTASAGMFKGGLADDGEMATKYHTATHLLHQALRNVLGDHVEQRGSNINEKRLRFDFVHPEALTPEQKQAVEDMVNEQIKAGLEVNFKEMSVDEAKNQGAIGLFDNKYGEKIKIYEVGSFSKEICGGPHVDNTKHLGHFHIKKEQSSSAGIRRIKAILE
ncbi:MAG: alanine--tRNA ligase [Candidatus Komeilibacteria bacterium]|nr:alanine--tRNA ligase [Candidatus Komeilibacteria bacterium]MBT4447673.1 alanine--tRNA ligase [Candidatus Komeilibacteria bacterium]